MIGATKEPPRPNPTAQPVPKARTCVGKACAKSAYMPTMAPLTKKPAAAQIAASIVRSCGVMPNTETMTVAMRMLPIESPCRRRLHQPLNGLGDENENDGDQHRRSDRAKIEHGAPVVYRKEALRKNPADHSSNGITDRIQRHAQVPAFCI